MLDHQPVEAPFVLAEATEVEAQEPSQKATAQAMPVTSSAPAKIQPRFRGDRASESERSSIGQPTRF